MINTIEKNDDKSSISIDKLFQDICSLSRWEVIRTFPIGRHSFFFPAKVYNVNLFRRFSAKNNVEKYMLKDSNEKEVALMDLKIYKDSVYIINFQIMQDKSYDKFALLMLQIAAEKSLYNTTEKEVHINIPSAFFAGLKLRKLITNNCFVSLLNQSDYEKRLFGEAFKLNVENSKQWLEKIEQLPILLNK